MRTSPQFWSSVNVSAMQSIALALLPDGGQRVARRNAWSSSAAHARMLRARREATLVLADAADRAEDRAADRVAGAAADPTAERTAGMSGPADRHEVSALPAPRGGLTLHAPAVR